MLNETNSLYHPNPGMPRGIEEETRINDLMKRNQRIEHWRILAAVAGFPISRLQPAESELLDMLDRVIIRGKGWGLNDILRGLHKSIPLSPKNLSRKGKRKSPRTYQRAIHNLDQLGLILFDGTSSNQLRTYAPAWWTDNLDGHALQVWQQASVIINSPGSNGHLCRTAVAQVTHLCRSHDAPPVGNEYLPAPNSRVACVADGATSVRTDTADGNRSNLEECF